MFDPELYRDKAEVEKWKQNCPIQGFIRKLEQAGYLSPGEVDGLEADVAQEIGRAVAFAEAGSLEPVEHLRQLPLKQLEFGDLLPDSAQLLGHEGVQPGTHGQTLSTVKLSHERFEIGEGEP